MIFALINLLSLGTNAINSSKILLNDIFNDYNNNVIPINDYPLDYGFSIKILK